MATNRSTSTLPRPHQNLARYSASELLAQELRNEILDGTLRSGESLREAELCERYNLARNTVREALRLLTRDGLGTHEVHRGVTVRAFTPQEVHSIFQLRGVLEETAANRAGSLTAEEIAGLEVALGQSEEAFGRGESRAGLNGNLAFHRELVKLAGNPRMDEAFAQLLTEIRLILATMEERSGGHWVRRNRELLRALIDGDANLFRCKLSEYLDVAEQEAIGALPE